MPLSVFDALPEMERAEMIAHVRIDRLFEAHLSKVQREVGDEEAKNKR